MPDLTERERVAGDLARLLADAETLSADLGRFAAGSSGQSRIVADAILAPSVDVVRKLRQMKYELGLIDAMNKETT